MKYLFTLLSFFFFSFSVNSQALIYIDVNYDNLKNSLEEGVYIESEEYFVLGSGEKFKAVYLNTYSKVAFAVLYYDAEGICTANAITFNNIKDLNKTIEAYNDVFVIKNNTTWKSYNKGSVYIAELLTKKDGSYFIFWSKQINY